MGATDLVINFKTAGDQVVIGALRSVGSAAVNFLGEAAGMALAFAKDSFAGAIDAQKGMDKLSASITRLGDNTPVTMDAALQLADQFKNLVGGSDDAVLAMTNVGLRFDKIGKDTFPTFIQSSADLAATLGIDGVRAAEILGKTLQDFSTDGAGALGRLKAAGVTLTDQQEEQIKKMIKAGDVAGAQKLLLDQLAATTGGAAAAAAGTFAGQMAIFQETVADAGEGIALALLPALTDLATKVLPLITPVITDVANAIGYFVGMLASGDIAAAFDSLGDSETFSAIFKALGISIYEVGPAVEAFAAQVREFITGVVVPAFQSAVAWVQANWPSIQAAIMDMWAQAQPVLAAVQAYIQTVLIPAFQAAVAWVIANWPLIQASIVAVMAEVQKAIDGAIKFIEGVWNVFQPAFEGNWYKFGENLRVAFDAAWEDIKALAGAAMDWFTQQDWGQIGTDILRGIADGISAATGFVIEAAQSAARAALEAAKGFLGIHSPSTVFAGLGENMMAGMAQGIDDAAMLPAQATAQAAYNSTVSVGAININGAGNPQAVAAAVRAEMDRMGRQTDVRLRTR